MVDRRRPRRVGDETRERIDELADGWAVPGAAAPAEGEGGEELSTDEIETKPQPRVSIAELMGGSPARGAGDGKGPERTSSGARGKQAVAPGAAGRAPRKSAPPPASGTGEARRKPVSVPPPLPGAGQRSKSASVPPPPPGAGQRSKSASVPPPPPSGGARNKSTGAPLPPPSGGARNKSASVPPPPPGADPGGDQGEDEATTEVSAAPALRRNRSASLRVDPIEMDAPATLPRKRGLYGDALYVKSVVLGVPGERRQRAQADKDLTEHRERRRTLLLDLARAALSLGESGGDDALCDQIVALEEERSRCAGIVAATDAELDAERRSAGDALAELRTAARATEDEVGKLSAELKPVERELASVRRRMADLKGTITTLDKRIAAEQAAAVGAGAGPRSREEIEAAVAALIAERDAYVAEEPELRTELERTQPRRDQLSTSLAEVRAKLERLTAEQGEMSARSEERIAALEARRTVEERAVSDVEKRRDDALLRLGGLLLAGEHPAPLAARIKPILAVDEDIAELERKRQAIDERLTAIDRGKLARGIAVWIAAAAVVAAVAVVVVLLAG